MKLARAICLHCKQVVDLDIEMAMCLFHFDGKRGPCPGVYEYRALTRFENLCDIIKRLLDWRAFFIMLLSGTPILLFSQIAFGTQIPSYWMVWLISILIFLVASFLLRKI